MKQNSNKTDSKAQECKTNGNSAKNRSNRNKRGGKSNFRDNRSANKQYKDDQMAKAQDYAKENFTSNDPAWYATDRALAIDAASIPFSWATGTVTDIGGALRIHSTGTQTPKTRSFVSPGICTLYIRPSVGAANTASDPINIAATAVYSFVRHANSGSANYDSPDLMLYIMAMGELIAFTNFLGRAYGLISMYATRNRYLPDPVIEAMGFDATDFRQNLAQFRYALNLALNKISSLAVPTTFSYLKRKAQIYNEMYIEGTSSKDQLYMLCPHSVFQIVEQQDSQGKISTSLNTVQWYNPARLKTVKETFTFLDSLVDPLIRSEDFNIMSGDILKAYGLNGILKFARIPEDYQAQIKFDIGMLEQIKNATIMPSTPGPMGEVEQDSTKGFLISDELVTLPNPSNAAYDMDLQAQWELTAEKRILTTTTDKTGPELVLENTRLMTPVIQTGTFTFQMCPGSEVVVAAQITVFDPTLLTFSQIQFESYPVFTNPATAAMLQGALESQAKLAAFDFAPSVMLTIVAANGDNLPYADNNFRFVRFANYAVLTAEDLQRMNEVALLNMLHVPAIGSVFS